MDLKEALDMDHRAEVDPHLAAHPEAHPVPALKAELDTAHPLEFPLPAVDMVDQLLLQKLPQLVALAIKDHPDRPALKVQVATQERTAVMETQAPTARTQNSNQLKLAKFASSAHKDHKVHQEAPDQKDLQDQREVPEKHHEMDNQ